MTTDNRDQLPEPLPNCRWCGLVVLEDEADEMDPDLHGTCFASWTRERNDAMREDDYDREREEKWLAAHYSPE